MLIDLTPLKRHRDFRLLFFGQLISDTGSMFTYVALPYQMYQLTHSSLSVGIIGLAQLVPLLVTALVGGALADSVNRRKLIIGAELGLAAGSVFLAFNALRGAGGTLSIYLAAAAISAMNGFHRPALGALTPRLVPKEELAAASALSSFKGNVARIGGPAIAGLSLSFLGLSATYALDAATFVFSIGMLGLIRNVPQQLDETKPGIGNILDGLRYALSRQELLGTYAVDIIAMVFGMPMALFPAVAESFGGARVLGWLYSAPEVGALIATVFSGWTVKVRRHGLAVIFAATAWGMAIVGFGFCHRLEIALLFLAAAGAADMVSGIFRLTIWNQTIPDRIRGRMAGIEMVSYMSGPLLGNAEAGLVAARWGLATSIISGGVLCVVGVLGCGLCLPKFWRYQASAVPRDESRGTGG